MLLLIPFFIFFLLVLPLKKQQKKQTTACFLFLSVKEHFFSPLCLGPTFGTEMLFFCFFLLFPLQPHQITALLTDRT